MAAQRHYFKLESSYGPADLFKTLKSTCEDAAFKKAAPAFEFDWIKRRVAISAATPHAAEEVLEALVKRVNKKAGTGMLLPGEAKKTDDGRTEIPVGVLLQSPDVYAEVIVQMLAEFGVRGIVTEEEGNGFSIPLNAMNRALEYREVIADFPLPDYLKIKDLGIK